MPLNDAQIENIKRLHEQIGPYVPMEEKEPLLDPPIDPLADSVLWLITLLLKLDKAIDALTLRVEKLEQNVSRTS